ncbi:hypothetical protein GOPIP_063_00730 [Gordonia polyisoprenivorans NBRC 16320 = JCM 10675]|nr:hypothetical protein GOPIP_063_00730 [Gordonia polyisoprenivorans NBRC 16320 = JCM 10675]
MIDTTTTLDVKDIDAEAVFAAIVTQLSDLQWNPEMTGPQAFGAMKQVLLLRNLIDHHATTLTGEMDRLGVGDHETTRLRELLISMGFAPAIAGRYVRISATTDVDLLLAHAADGSISSEHTDAIIRGLAHIDTRSPNPSTPCNGASSCGDCCRITLRVSPASTRNAGRCRRITAGPCDSTTPQPDLRCPTT